MVLVPEIKLIRTDTTLDLSQKAEKVCLPPRLAPLFYRAARPNRLRVLGQLPPTSAHDACGVPPSRKPCHLFTLCRLFVCLWCFSSLAAVSERMVESLF